MIIMWIGGNDVYPRFLGAEPTTRVGGGSEPAAVIWAELDEAVRWAAGAESVLIVGPTPRPRYDGAARWEATAAFRLERILARMAREIGPAVAFVAVGRRLCRRVRIPGLGPDEFFVDERYFNSDGVHITARAYREMAKRLPAWVRVAGP